MINLQKQLIQSAAKNVDKTGCNKQQLLLYPCCVMDFFEIKKFKFGILKTQKFIETMVLESRPPCHSVRNPGNNRIGNSRRSAPAASARWAFCQRHSAKYNYSNLWKVHHSFTFANRKYAVTNLESTIPCYVHFCMTWSLCDNEFAQNEYLTQNQLRKNFFSAPKT
jgi:hypothetical protein